MLIDILMARNMGFLILIIFFKLATLVLYESLALSFKDLCKCVRQSVYSNGCSIFLIVFEKMA